MGIPLQEWDRSVGPVLKDIEVDAYYVENYLNKICNSLTRLMVRPAFDTKAEASIDECIKKIKVALHELERAKSIYERRPLDE